VSEEVKPATDEEIERLFFEVEGMDCENVTLEMSQRFFRRVKARIDAEKAKNAELTERYNELVKLTVPSDSDAEEKANLRALNSEMLAALFGIKQLFDGLPAQFVALSGAIEVLIRRTRNVRPILSVACGGIAEYCERNPKR